MRGALAKELAILVMNQVQERIEKKLFDTQELVLWHYSTGNQSLPIPGVVVRQETNKVIIRARLDGTLKEFAVDPSELSKR